MKKFLRKILIFALIAMVSGFLLLTVMHRLVYYRLQEFRPDQKVTSVFVGDSHIQCAIQDNQLPDSRNMGKSSESYYYSYYKLKFLLRTNPGIRRVYLGFGYHSLAASYDDFVTGEFSVTVSPRYFFLLSGEEQLKMLKINRKDWLSYTRNLLRAAVSILLSPGHNTFTGSYDNTFADVKAVQSSMDKRIRFQFYGEKGLQDFSELNLEYLNKIAALCKSSGVELILLSTPIHPYYRNQIPAEYLGKYRKIIGESKLQVIDFKKMELPDQGFIPDGDHVSVSGAALTTGELRRLYHKPEIQ